jgi:hypothetical protein
MDKLYKYATITMVSIVIACVVMGYIGYQVGGNAATDDQADQQAGGGTSYNPFIIQNLGLGDTNEYIGFFAAGAVGGFLVGYIFPTFMTKTAKLEQPGRRSE